MTSQQARYYLAGIIDGEGHVRTRRESRRVEITTTDLGILAATCEALAVLEIEYRVKPKKGANLPAFAINIYGRQNYKKLNLLPLRSKRAQALQELVDGYVRREPVSKKEWEGLIADGLTHREMAERLGYKQHSTVQYHLRKCGLI